MGMGLFLWYYKVSGADNILKIVAYLQVIAIAFPLLSSVCVQCLLNKNIMQGIINIC
ncbi:putative lantibiotic ABC transporter, permease domain protein [Clostridioides difficile P32]|nr:putative lantibiotic ABC transporter, permease domain protein [Clostridioides difficile P32]